MDSSSYSLLYFALSAALVLGVQAVDGVLEVDNLNSNVESLLGCREEFVCEGVGNAVEWEFRVGRTRPRNVSVNMVTTAVAGVNVRSSLVFPPDIDVSIGRPITYRCTIKGGPISISLDTTLTVQNTDVFIEPIADIDISDKSVGETLSFACNVFTCQGGVEVAILKGSQLLAERNFTDDKDVWVPVSLTISEDTADTYVCLVVLPDRRTFNETFMVTGTPRRPPPTSNFLPDTNPNDPQPIDDSTVSPPAAHRGSATVNSPHIQVIIVSLLVLCLAALLTL